MLVYYTLLLDNKDFLFELIIKVVLLFIYLINNSFYLIIAYNNTSTLIIILKYLRLKIILEINYNNYYLIIS